MSLRRLPLAILTRWISVYRIAEFQFPEATIHYIVKDICYLEALEYSYCAET